MTTKVSIDDAIVFLINRHDGRANKDGLTEEDREHNRKFAFFQDHVAEVGELTLPVGKNAENVRQIVDTVTKYVEDPTQTKPLSFAIFGPPGSGKSSFVKGIAKQIETLSLVKTANLTQVARVEEIANTLRDALKIGQAVPDVPIIFFDEFDAMREGTPFGWLSWFLAPMEDGKFLWKGEELPVGKAVFIFAGGTAETLDDFVGNAQQDPEAFRARKVPDFVSRLRGAINIEGVNGDKDERIIRRTLALTFQMSADDAKDRGRDWLAQVLQYGYFVHGARSLNTFVRAESTAAGAAGLSQVIRRQHVTRGQFDGLLVGISASLDGDGTQGLSEELTRQLLRSGASLAYAGASFAGGTLPTLIDVAKSTPPALIDDETGLARVVNYMAVPANTPTQKDDPGIFRSVRLDTLYATELDGLGAPTTGFFRAISGDEQAYQVGHHAAWAISLFRLRLRLLQDVSALIAVGGKDDGSSWGRLPGVAEEVMIAIAMRKPVYIIGNLGGAAEAAGKLLSLGEASVKPDSCLVSLAKDREAELLRTCGDAFGIPGVAASPMGIIDLRKFLFDHGVTTSGWPENGLDLFENRELFKCDVEKHPEEAVKLIFKGMSRLSLAEKQKSGG